MMKTVQIIYITQIIKPHLKNSGKKHNYIF